LGYASPYFLTFKQASELGGFVKKGERGTPVVFWKWIEIEDKETHETTRVPFLKYYTVFRIGGRTRARSGLAVRKRPPTMLLFWHPYLRPDEV
jgi:hypothetical protein